MLFCCHSFLYSPLSSYGLALFMKLTDILLDASYVDPLGPQMERPKTAAKKRIDEDEFADEELGDDLLPE